MSEGGIVIAYDPRLQAAVSPGARLVRLSDRAKHSEGPTYIPEDGSVIWSDVSGNRLLRWSPDRGTQIIRDPAHHQNGNYRDLEGRLVSCSHGQRGIIRQERDGQWRVLVDRYRGDRLNSPNDLMVKSDGTIWFTDPPFGLTQPDEGYGGQQEQPGSFVYRFDPVSGEIDAVITEMERPNGLAFSPDEQILYVSDTSQVNYPQGHHYIRAYDLVSEKQVTNSRVFAVVSPGQADGFRVSQRGNIFTSSADSVQIYASDGTLLGKILVPEVCTNLTFGGADEARLFVTAGRSLYLIYLREQS